MHKATHFLATDLDGTFVGDAGGLKALLRHFEEAPYTVSLIYITGRHYASACSLIESEGLPHPDVLVTDIGTSIYWGETLELDEEWNSRMTRGWEPGRIKELAAGFPGLTPQELPDERRVSFYADSLETARKFESILKAHHIEHKLIYSTGRDLDVLPTASGKGAALSYLRDQEMFKDAAVLVAGDSGNDREMLTLGLPAVIVGNGHPELEDIVENHTIYRAKARCAGGILEAWQHFYPHRLFTAGQ